MNLQENILLLKFKITDYLQELVILLISFVIVSLLSSIISLPIKENYWPLNSLTLRFVIWILLFLFLNEIWGEGKSFLKRGRKYIFRYNDFPDKWVFHGGVVAEANPSRLIVKMSNSGCLLKEYLWKDFEMKFDMKFLADVSNESGLVRSLGVIFRAENLDSYFMLEIIIHNGKLYLKPHVRLRGNWEIIDLQEKGSMGTKDFIRIKITVTDQVCKIYINDNKFYEWILPKGVDTYRDVASGNSEPSVDKERVGTSKIVPEIKFRDKHGMIGFRAYPQQGAIIQNLRVKSI